MVDNYPHIIFLLIPSKLITLRKKVRELPTFTLEIFKIRVEGQNFHKVPKGSNPNKKCHKLWKKSIIIFLAKIFLTPTFFSPKNFFIQNFFAIQFFVSHTKLNLPQKLSDPKFFWILFSTKSFSTKQFFWPHKFFDPTNFFTWNLFGQIFFQKKFMTINFITKYFWTNNFLTKNFFFDQNFWTTFLTTKIVQQIKWVLTQLKIT